ncbi:MAG: YbjQ family protein [Sterolibacteriaceae bacterium]|nr:YbjQ family protein [Sterolibacteriaceae bacterium]MBK9083780.1 YbjQ family protein [Sterolibacteriaceae bacterium]
MRRVHELVLTTAPSIDGYRVSKTLDIVTAECVLGMNMFRDMLTAVTDVIGGPSGTSQNALRELRQRCIHDLRIEAAQLQADGIIGVALNYSELSGGGKSMIFLVASGTAVNLKSL